MSYTITSDNNGYYFSIYLPTGIAPSSTPVVKFLERPALSYGTANIDNESLFFPGAVKVKFYSDYDNLFDYLYNSDTTLFLYENNTLIFKGKIDAEEIGYIPSQNIYELTFVDLSQQLKTKSYDVISEYVGYYTKTNILDIIRRILLEISVTLGTIKGAECLTVESSYNSGNGYVERDFSAMGTDPAYFFDGTYKTLWDVLEAILSSFGFLGFFIGDKFELRFRFDNSSSIVTAEKLKHDYEIGWVGAYDYLTASIRSGGTSRENKIIDHRAVTSKPPIKDIVYNYEVPAGSLPGGNNFNNLYVYLPAYIVGIGYEGFYGTRDNTVDINGSGIKKSLWQQLLDKVDARISVKRRRLKAHIFDDTIALFDVLQVDGHNYVITEISRELGKKITKVTGISIN